MANDSKTEKQDVEDPLGAGPTEDQKKLLSLDFERVEQRIFENVGKRIRNYLVVAASLVTIFGLVAAVGLKTAIKDATVSAFRNDAALRESIKDDAAGKVARADEILKEMEARLEQAKEAKLEAANSTLRELEKLLEAAKQEKQEENLLFARSALELSELVSELLKLRERAGSDK